MKFDLNKEKNEFSYYYSHNGATLGPFSISQLLQKIDADTLVYRDGISWTNAKDVQEISKFFKTHNIENVNIISSGNSTSSDLSSKPKKMFSSSFSFDGRIRRLEYGISIIIFYIAYIIIFALMAIDSESADLLATLALIPLFWFFLAQGSKRCHDLGNSGWFQIIPFYILLMLFVEGNRDTNEYGNSPK
jgi:uncharacterized membrane protein YhaH (DUF805 family)